MIQILYGPIASGKSTYCRDQAATGAIIVNDDAITTAIHGGDYVYDIERKPIYKAVLVNMVTTALVAGRPVVIDKPNYRRSTRDFYRLLGKLFDAKVYLVGFRKGEFKGAEDGRRRFEADPRGLTLMKWEEVGAAHARLHEPICVEERLRYSGVSYIEWKDKQ